jgi:uncharacterized protein (TIGR04222 family)
MDFLLDNPLANMNGTTFLILYVVLLAAGIASYYILKRNLDWTAKMPLPKVPENPEPYEIAYFRGGDNELSRTVIFSLVQKGFLEITNGGKKSYIRLAKTQPNWTTIPQIERTALSWFKETREASEVFDSFGLSAHLEPYFNEYARQLEAASFLTPADVVRKGQIFAAGIGGALLLLGGYKLIAAIAHGRFNIFFLILLMIITIGVFAYLSVFPRLSARGTAYLTRFQNAFDTLRVRTQAGLTPTAAGHQTLSVDPMLLAMGVFGVGALSGTMFSEYERAFKKSGAAGTGGCGSAGCSSSSCSSGDGGSSCGGGCGGCGGGGD